VLFGVSFFLAIATFKEYAGFSYSNPIALWIVYILWPLICTVVYIVSQLILVFRTLEDRWPVGDIVFGTAFFAVAQVILFAFSVTICDAIKHYIDGLFFFTLCMLLSVMMVYKYWDSITVRNRSRLFYVANGPDRGRISSSPSDPRSPSGKSRTSRWEQTTTKRRAASTIAVYVATLRRDISRRVSFPPHMRQPGVRILPCLLSISFTPASPPKRPSFRSSHTPSRFTYIRKHSRHGRWNLPFFRFCFPSLTQRH
jgi:hypothetical protein